MRVFVWVMFVGSWLTILTAILVLACVKSWPHSITRARWEYATKLIVAICVMVWEAVLLFGKF